MTWLTGIDSRAVEIVHIGYKFGGNDSVGENKAYLAGRKGSQDEGTMRHINHREDRLHAYRSCLPVTTVAMALTPRNYTVTSS